MSSFGTTGGELLGIGRSYIISTSLKDALMEDREEFALKRCLNASGMRWHSDRFGPNVSRAEDIICPSPKNCEGTRIGGNFRKP